MLLIVRSQMSWVVCIGMFVIQLSQISFYSNSSRGSAWYAESQETSRGRQTTWSHIFIRFLHQDLQRGICRETSREEDPWVWGNGQKVCREMEGNTLKHRKWSLKITFGYVFLEMYRNKKYGYYLFVLELSKCDLEISKIWPYTEQIWPWTKQIWPWTRKIDIKLGPRPWHGTFRRYWKMVESITRKQGE